MIVEIEQLHVRVLRQSPKGQSPAAYIGEVGQFFFQGEIIKCLHGSLLQKRKGARKNPDAFVLKRLYIKN